MTRLQKKLYEAFKTTHSSRRKLTYGRGDGMKSPKAKRK